MSQGDLRCRIHGISYAISYECDTLQDLLIYFLLGYCIRHPIYVISYTMQHLYDIVWNIVYVRYSIGYSILRCVIRYSIQYSIQEDHNIPQDILCIRYRIHRINISKQYMISQGTKNPDHDDDQYCVQMLHILHILHILGHRFNKGICCTFNAQYCTQYWNT